jgi:hypothetical protein
MLMLYGMAKNIAQKNDSGPNNGVSRRSIYVEWNSKKYADRTR